MGKHCLVLGSQQPQVGSREAGEAPSTQPRISRAEDGFVSRVHSGLRTAGSCGRRGPRADLHAVPAAPRPFPVPRGRSFRADSASCRSPFPKPPAEPARGSAHGGGRAAGQHRAGRHAGRQLTSQNSFPARIPGWVGARSHRRAARGAIYGPREHPSQAGRSSSTRGLARSGAGRKLLRERRDARRKQVAGEGSAAGAGPAGSRDPGHAWHMAGSGVPPSIAQGAERAAGNRRPRGRSRRTDASVRAERAMGHGRKSAEAAPGAPPAVPQQPRGHRAPRGGGSGATCGHSERSSCPPPAPRCGHSPAFSARPRPCPAGSPGTSCPPAAPRQAPAPVRSRSGTAPPGRARSRSRAAPRSPAPARPGPALPRPRPPPPLVLRSGRDGPDRSRRPSPAPPRHGRPRRVGSGPGFPPPRGPAAPGEASEVRSPGWARAARPRRSLFV